MATSLVTYSLGQARGVFPVDAIIEIYRMVAFIPVTDAPPRVIGYTSFRGTPLFGIDVQDIFEIRGHVFDSDAGLIVTKANSIKFGILVDRIGEITRVEESMEIPREQYPSELKDRCIARAYAIEDTPHFELDLSRLFTESEVSRLVEYSSTVEGTRIQ